MKSYERKKNMIKWICTREEKWFNKWNVLVLSDIDSSFFQSTYRVSAYKKYGMDWELLIGIDDNDNILLGSANVIVKFAFFRLYICSYGPTINSSCKKTEYYNEFFTRFKNRAEELKAFISQITIPIDLSLKTQLKSIEGCLFSNISNPHYTNIINLKNNNSWLSKEELISTFLPKGRRDVRAAYRKGLVSKFPTTENELQIAYSCIENNAKNKGYYVRGWDEMKDFILESVNNNIAYVITAWYNDIIQGAILIEKSCNMLTYTMGGVYRHKPDLLTGYFLQFEAMMLAISLEIEIYDVSYGGPSEVQRFKGMFNPNLIEGYKTVHFKHSNIKYWLFSKSYSFIKSQIPKIISIKQKLFK